MQLQSGLVIKNKSPAAVSLCSKTYTSVNKTENNANLLCNKLFLGQTTRTEIRELYNKVSILSHLRKNRENLTLEIHIEEEKKVEKNET